VVPTVIASDSSIITQFPYPDTPDSVKQEVLAEAAALFAQIQLDKAEIATRITQVIDEFADAKAEEAAEITTLRNDVMNAVAQAIVNAQESLEEDRTDALMQFAALQQFATDQLHALRVMAANSKATIQELRDELLQSREAAYQAALAYRERCEQDMAASDDGMNKLVTTRLDSLPSIRQDRDVNWHPFVVQMEKNTYLGWHGDFTPPPPPPPPILNTDSLQHASPFVTSRLIINRQYRERPSDGLCPEYRNLSDIVNVGDSTISHVPVLNVPLRSFKITFRQNLMGEKLDDGQVRGEWWAIGNELAGAAMGAAIGMASMCFVRGRLSTCRPRDSIRGMLRRALR
jgi:hypothetical protein